MPHVAVVTITAPKRAVQKMLAAVSAFAQPTEIIEGKKSWEKTTLVYEAESEQSAHNIATTIAQLGYLGTMVQCGVPEKMEMEAPPKLHTSRWLTGRR